MLLLFDRLTGKVSAKKKDRKKKKRKMTSLEHILKHLDEKYRETLCMHVFKQKGFRCT